MKEKKKVNKPVICIVILIFLFVGLRIANYNHKFGLDKSVISGSRTPNAEETVRLYLYYCNRSEYDKAEKLTTSDLTYKMYFPSIRIVEITPSDYNKKNKKEAFFDVVYNQEYFWAFDEKGDSSISVDFDLKKTKDGWRITSIGNG